MNTIPTEFVGQTWKSPFTGQDIDAHLVRREAAANLAVKMFLFRLLGLPEPKWEIYRDSLNYANAGSQPLTGCLPFPPELAEYIAEGFMVEHVMARQHLGLPCQEMDELMPTPAHAEKRGSILRHFRAVDSLLAFIAQGVSWPGNHILGLHGSVDPGLPEKLRNAGIYHILVWREEHLPDSKCTPEDLRPFFGSGAMQLLSREEASVFALDAYAQRGDRITQIFHLHEDWEFDSWSGHHPMFSAPQQQTTPSSNLQ